jgi:hypothetical protein
LTCSHSSAAKRASINQRIAERKQPFIGTHMQLLHLRTAVHECSARTTGLSPEFASTQVGRPVIGHVTVVNMQL